MAAAAATPGDEELEDLQENEAFEALEQDFQRVLDTLVGDDALERFKDEYVRLHDALKRSHENERRLAKRVRELNQEMTQNATRLANALKATEDEDTEADRLRKQVEKAWAMMEAAEAKEMAAQKTIEKLRTDIASLDAVVDRYTELLGEDTTLEDVISARDAYKRRFKDAQEQADFERSRAEELMTKLEERRAKLKEQKQLVVELRVQLRQKEDEERRESKRMERTREEMEKLKTTSVQKERELEELRTAYEQSEAAGQDVQQQLSEAKDMIRKTMMDINEVHVRSEKYKAKIEDYEHRMVVLQDEVATQQSGVRKARQDLSRMDAEKRRLLGKLKGAESQQLLLRRQLADARQDLETLRATLSDKEHEADTASRSAHQARGHISRLEHKVKHEEEKRMKEATLKRDAEEAHKGAEQTIQKRDAQLQAFTRQHEQMRSALMSLERQNMQHKLRLEERDKHIAEVEAAVRLREAQVADAEKREAESEARLKQQRQLYDAVRADRNLFSKHLIEAQDEIAELRRKLKIMARQVDQLKDDVAAKDRSLVAVHFDNKAAMQRLDDKAREVEELRSIQAKTEANVKQQAAVVDELNAAIRKMDEEAAEQRRRVGQLVNERDILGTQLIRRNDELALLYEKIDIMESTLKKGSAQYQERMEDIRVLKLKIGDLRRQLSLANSAAGRVSELQREVVRLQREVMAERTKVKALSEELENPMNIHRWRKLEGSDPATYELIQKVQTLQRRLIAKTQEAVEKEMVIQEKERLYAEAKELLARQPGPEIAEQMSTLQKALRERSRQLKAMASELNMAQAQTGEYRFEVDRLNRDLQEARRQYQGGRRREALDGQRAAAGAMAATVGAAPLREAAAGGAARLAPEPERLLQTQRAHAAATGPRFTGGGFNTRQ